VGYLSAHLVSLVLGFLLLLRIDRALWFFGDEWDFIVDRGLHHPALSIWQPHNEHWSTLPILLWRLLYTIDGLHSYWLYLVPALLCHVAIAHLAWRRMVREGADQLLAVLIALIFILTGAGAENTTWAFQIGFIGSVLFGYLAVETLDTSNWSLWRDIVASALLVASLMCSTIGDSMVVVVSIILLRSRGIRRTLPVIIPPICIYLVWYGVVGRHAVAADHVTGTTFTEVPTYLWTGLSSALGGIFGYVDAGSALMIGALLWLTLRGREIYERRPVVFGCTAGVLSFFLLAGLGRVGLGASEATASRYAYVAFALLIPLIAAILTEGARAHAPGRWILSLLLCGVLLSNIATLRTFAETRATQVQAEKVDVLTTATLLADGAKSLTLAPVQFDGNLGPQAMIRLVREGILPRVSVSETQTLDDEAAMGVALSANPISLHPFKLLGNSESTILHTVPGCSSFLSTGPTPQIELQVTGSGSSGRLTTTPGASLTWTLVPAAGPAGIGVTEPVGPAGVDYLEDVYSSAYLVLTLPESGEVTICGL
jgi:hypothetical protein